jgi:hypothetical protein
MLLKILIIIINNKTNNFFSGVYDVRRNPKYLNGEMSEDQILRNFLNTFDTKGKEDGIVN